MTPHQQETKKLKYILLLMTIVTVIVVVAINKLENWAAIRVMRGLCE